MNVFQFLGLKENHRDKKKVVQLCKHSDEVTESRKSYPKVGQVKKDGVYSITVVKPNNEVEIFSRTGMKFTNTDILTDQIKRSNFRVGVYIAELCCDACYLEVLSGIVNPNRNKVLSEDKENVKAVMYLAFHDFLPIEEFIGGKSYIGYADRHYHLSQILPINMNLLDAYEIKDQEQEDKFFDDVVADGEEGIVLKNPEADWVAGHKGWRTMKRVRGWSGDLLCIRAEEGVGKMKGKIGNLFFKWKDGKEVKCPLGKGYTHEDAKGMWQTYKHVEAGLHDTSINGTPIGQIFEVYALQESSKGKLRLPKVGELRIDKTEADV